MKLVKEFLLTFVIAFVATSLITYLYTLIFHSQGIVNWQIAFTMSIIFGIIIPLIQRKRSI